MRWLLRSIVLSLTFENLYSSALLLPVPPILPSLPPPYTMLLQKPMGIIALLDEQW